MGKPAALFPFHLNPTMAQPWADAGVDCYLVDSQHPKGERRDGNLIYVGADIHRWNPPIRRFVFGFSSPPCTDVAVSGARWFAGKGLYALSDAIACFARSIEIFRSLDCPNGHENPATVISTHWRKADGIVHPFEFTGLCIDDNYTKATHLWSENGFVLPEPDVHPMVATAVAFVKANCKGRLLSKDKVMARFPANELLREWYPDNRIHAEGPSDERANIRSAAPIGLALATFAANRHVLLEAAA